MLQGSKCIWLTEGTERKIPREDCLACARRGGNPCGYPLPIIKQVLSDRDPNVVQCSATMISGCAREQGIKKHLEWFINPEKAYTRAHGSLLHLGAEIRASHEEGVMVEDRLSRPIQLRDGREVTVTAQVDLVLIDDSDWFGWHYRLVDYKTVSSLAPSKLKMKVASYIPQLSIQRWLLDSRDAIVDIADIVFLSHDDRRVVNLLPGDEEACLMSIEETEQYLLDRLPALADSLEGNYSPPLSDPADFWRCRNCDVQAECVTLNGGSIPALEAPHAYRHAG